MSFHGRGPQAASFPSSSGFAIGCQGNAIVYALTPWGTELREPIEGLIRWSTPLMTSG